MPNRWSTKDLDKLYTLVDDVTYFLPMPISITRGTYDFLKTMNNQENKNIEEINLKMRPNHWGGFCDWCGCYNKKYVNEYNTDRDICTDCIIEVYNFAKKEIL